MAFELGSTPLPLLPSQAKDTAGAKYEQVLQQTGTRLGAASRLPAGWKWCHNRHPDSWQLDAQLCSASAIWRAAAGGLPYPQSPPSPPPNPCQAKEGARGAADTAAAKADEARASAGEL